MIRPIEMQTTLPMDLSNAVVSTTTKVWNMLVASRDGNLERIKALSGECPELVYAPHNYTPPVHFYLHKVQIQINQEHPGRRRSCGREKRV